MSSSRILSVDKRTRCPATGSERRNAGPSCKPRRSTRLWSRGIRRAPVQAREERPASVRAGGHLKWLGCYAPTPYGDAGDCSSSAADAPADAEALRTARALVGRLPLLGGALTYGDGLNRARTWYATLSAMLGARASISARSRSTSARRSSRLCHNTYRCPQLCSGKMVRSPSTGTKAAIAVLYSGYGSIQYAARRSCSVRTDSASPTTRTP
jgi:hypothetical protein